MKICAMTMVYRDYWALAQWYRHYGGHLGPRNLYVIAHGHDPRIAEICPEASIITIPRDELKHFDRVRLRLMNDIQSGLGNVYDWVIQTDTDELVCLNPDQHASFADLFATAEAPVLFGLGLNLAEAKDDPEMPEGANVFSYRKTACVTGNYSKAWAVSNGMALRWHGVFCGYKRAHKFPFVMPDGVFFVHLKHAHRGALEDANEVRQSVAETVGEEWNVTGWAKADFRAKRFFRKLAKAEYLEWDAAIARGYEQIRGNPVRDSERGIVKPPFINYVCRTDLPEWFSRA
ncbi:glycosyltransferase family 2 protein [Sulfitobacter albidus]|uniref:Glycosyltransferase family 2 protein n=1 Tax=Sulfitobacter albidus TaxID=2829501 RepID=A0A975JDN2_9RHOB|nr:glycosyltransferase family 2 protein [Sulfitobacter albidus]QUJ76559.1 glycosyltransferase family 2 protein [Sulfitobacter albidus]